MKNIAKIETTKNADKILSVSVPVIFFKNKETGNIIADCPLLDLCTYAPTLSMAKKYFVEAYQLWYETIEAMGTIKQVLTGLGWKICKNSIKLPKEAKFTKYEEAIQLISHTNFDVNINRAYLQ